jgi:hypothetical protein
MGPGSGKGMEQVRGPSSVRVGAGNCRDFLGLEIRTGSRGQEVAGLGQV